MHGPLGSTMVAREPGYRSVLTSERLVPLWVEAAGHVDALERSDPDWWRWRTALAALVSAMQEAEELAGAIEPRLGRRDWTTRATR